MLKTLLLLSGSWLDKIADRVNNKFVKDENGSNSTAFLSKKSKNIKSKDLMYI